MTLNLKSEGEVPTVATALEAVVVSPPMPTRATTVKYAKMAVSPVPTLALPLEVVSPMTLNLKGEEMPTHATTLEGSDSDAAVCLTTTNSLRPTRPTTNTGQNIPKTSTRPTSAAEMPSRPGMKADLSTWPMLPPTRATSSACHWPPHPLLRPSYRRVPHVSPALL
jgi:hypothetical protein